MIPIYIYILINESIISYKSYATLCVEDTSSRVLINYATITITI